MRINEFTQNKLSEAPKYKLNKDGTYTLIKEPDQPKTSKKFGDDFMNYLKGMPGAAVDNIKALGNLVTTGTASASTDTDADGGQETPMDPVNDDPMSAVNQAKDRTISPKKVVSKRPRTTYSSLAKASGIADPNKIKVGQKITLPGGGSYSVQSGDTLSGIAQKVRKGNIGGGGNDGTTTQSNLAPPKKDFGLGGLDVTGPVRRGDGKSSAVKDLPPVKNVKTFKTMPIKIPKVQPKVQPNVVPKNVSQGSTTTQKSVGDAGGFTGKFIDKKGDVAYTSPKAFAQNLLPGVFGTPKGQEIPSNLKRINPATKGAEKGTRFQQVNAPKKTNKDANFFSKEFDKIKSDFKTAVDTTKKNFGPGRNTLASKGTSNIIGNKNFVSDKK
jgi:LysM repeat protein